LTADLSEVSALLVAFRDGRVAPEQFTERYAGLWQELTDEQDAAIAADGTVRSALPRLREMEGRGEISTEEYQARVQRLYAGLSGLRLRPGTAAANALDQLYVLADAWDAPQNAERQLVSVDELREVVARALGALESASTSD
jgi:hypothetical protein